MGNDMTKVATLLQGRLRLKGDYAVLELSVEDCERDEKQDCWYFFDPEFQTYHRLNFKELVDATVGDTAKQLILRYTWKRKVGN